MSVDKSRKWTNKDGVSPIVAAAILNDPYTRGNSDVSVTQLIDSPYVRKQMARPEMSDVPVEISTRTYALLGKAVHSLLETGMAGLGDDGIREVTEATGIVYHDLEVEKRWYCKDLGVTWSGQADLYYAIEENGEKVFVLEDHKLCSVGEYSAQRGEDKWTHQLNLLALLARRNGQRVDRLAINAYFRDWSKAKAFFGHDPEYPPSQHVRIPIKLWSQERQQTYLLDRLALHLDPNPSPCTREERWERDPKWRVFIEGAPRAMRLLNSKEDAEEWLADGIRKVTEQLESATERKATTERAVLQKKATRGKIMARLRELRSAAIAPAGGLPLRCFMYCEASAICPAYAALKDEANRYSNSPTRVDTSNDPLKRG
jgi:hypothetical protein